MPFCYLHNRMDGNLQSLSGGITFISDFFIIFKNVMQPYSLNPNPQGKPYIRNQNFYTVINGDIDQNVFFCTIKSTRNGRLQKGFLKTAVPPTFVSTEKYVLFNISIYNRAKNHVIDISLPLRDRVKTICLVHVLRNFDKSLKHVIILRETFSS